MTGRIGTAERTAVVCAPLFFIVLLACFTVFSPHLVQQTQGFFPDTLSPESRDSISGVLPAQEQFHILRGNVSLQTVFRIQPFSGFVSAGPAQEIPLHFLFGAGQLFFRTVFPSFFLRFLGKHCPVRAGPGI